MPHFHLNINSISRTAKRGGPEAAAYRAGERIRDERTGKLHDFSHRTDVVYKEILLPNTAKQTPDWVHDRARLWNAAEAAEHRRNSRVAREYQVTLPLELGPPQRLKLARRFAHAIADRHNIVVDLAIHDPPAHGDPRNFHAHLLVTTREITATGLGTKAGLDLSFSESLKRGLQGLKEMHYVRERWAALTNEAYREAGLDLRVDHRTLAAQGIDRAPKHKPYGVYHMERIRLRREITDSLAERYQERVARSAAVQAPQTPTPAGGASALIDEARRRGREAWLALRRESADNTKSLQQEPAVASPSIDEDHSL